MNSAPGASRSPLLALFWKAVAGDAPGKSFDAPLRSFARVSARFGDDNDEMVFMIIILDTLNASIQPVFLCRRTPFMKKLLVIYSLTE